MFWAEPNSQTCIHADMQQLETTCAVWVAHNALLSLELIEQ